MAYSLQYISCFHSYYLQQQKLIMAYSRHPQIQANQNLQQQKLIMAYSLQVAVRCLGRSTIVEINYGLQPEQDDKSSNVNLQQQKLIMAYSLEIQNTFEPESTIVEINYGLQPIQLRFTEQGKSTIVEINYGLQPEIRNLNMNSIYNSRN